MNLDLYKIISFIVKERYGKNLPEFLSEQKILHIDTSGNVEVVEIPFPIEKGIYGALSLDQQLDLYNFLRSEGFVWRSERTHAQWGTREAVEKVNKRLIAFTVGSTRDKILLYGSLEFVVRDLLLDNISQGFKINWELYTIYEN